jgi:hypothetical protein
MPEGVGYGPQNTASVGKNLNVIGNHCYAFSGLVTVQAQQTVLEFTTGQFYVKGFLDSFMGEGDTGFHETILNYNGVDVLTDFIEHGSGAHNSTRVPIHIIIPPLTLVRVKLRFNSETDNASAQITGRIYGNVK